MLSEDENDQNTLVNSVMASMTELNQIHDEIMTLDAMPIERGMAIVNLYMHSQSIYGGRIDLARDVQHVKAVWEAHYRYREKDLALSRAKAEQRALWLVPLIRWGFGAVGSSAFALGTLMWFLSRT